MIMVMMMIMMIMMMMMMMMVINISNNHQSSLSSFIGILTSRNERKAFPLIMLNNGKWMIGF